MFEVVQDIAQDSWSLVHIEGPAIETEVLDWNGLPLFLNSVDGSVLHFDGEPIDFPFSDAHTFWIGDKRQARMIIRSTEDGDIEIIGASPDGVILYSASESQSWPLNAVFNNTIRIARSTLESLSLNVVDATYCDFLSSGHHKPNADNWIPAIVVEANLCDNAKVQIVQDTVSDHDEHRLEGMIYTAYTYNSAMSRPNIAVRDMALDAAI